MRIEEAIARAMDRGDKDVLIVVDVESLHGGAGVEYYDDGSFSVVAVAEDGTVFEVGVYDADEPVYDCAVDSVLREMRLYEED